MKLGANVAVNLTAQVWTALMNFAFVPLYIRFMGIEGYGLIGLFVTLMGIFTLLDLGLAITVNREIARRGAGDDERREARSLLRTLELIYWAIGALIGATIALAAPIIARDWLNLQVIPLDQAVRAVRLMGLVAFVRWPLSLYLGALQGMQRQIVANAITSAGATVAGGGATLVLWLISPRVDLFFAWQTAAFACLVAALRLAAWRGLALVGDRPRASFALVRASAAFSAGVVGITLLGLVLAQSANLLLIRQLPLEEFGYYTLALSIVGLLMNFGASVQTAVFPLLTTAVARGDRIRERALYHMASQGLAVLLMPSAVTLALFAPELLSAYLNAPLIVDRTHLLLSLLAIGIGCGVTIYLPVSLQLAHGWTKLSFYKNVVAIPIYVPLLLVLVPRFGAIGAAACLIALNIGYVLFEVPIMHRLLLRGELARWYFIDMGVPLVVSLIIQTCVRLILPADASLMLTLGLIGIGGLLAVAGSILLLPDLRTAGLNFLATSGICRRACRRSIQLDI